MATATETKYPRNIDFKHECGHAGPLEAIDEEHEARLRQETARELCYECQCVCPCCDQDTSGTSLMFTIPQAARQLGMAEADVRTMVAEGRLRAYPVGATVGIHRYDIARVLRPVRNPSAA